MTVIAKLDGFGWLLDHELHIDECYKGVVASKLQHSLSPKDCDLISFKSKRGFFDIYRPFIMDSRFEKQQRTAQNRSNVTENIGNGLDKYVVQKGTVKKRKLEVSTEFDNVLVHTDDSLDIGPSDEHGVIYGSSLTENVCKRSNENKSSAAESHAMIINFLNGAIQCLQSNNVNLSNYPEAMGNDNNIIARKTAKSTLCAGISLAEMCQSTKDQKPVVDPVSVTTLGSATESVVNRLVFNEDARAMGVAFSGENYLIPPRCTFLLSDISGSEPLLANVSGKFDIIVLDPPWENKCVKRKKGYKMMRDTDLLSIPIGRLANDTRCLVAVWTTNKQKQIDFVKNQLFSMWNTRYLTQWHWLKVTRSGIPVSPLFESSAKKPYENILFGIIQSTSSAEINGHPCKLPGGIEEFPCERRVLVSVPCSIHSRKPPLDDVLRPFIPVGANCLEIFARNLLPNWTSWGNEVLQFQHVDFFSRSQR